MSRSDLNFNYSLSEFHDSINELLSHSQATKLELINHNQRIWAHEISEATLKMVESCAAAKELTILAKDHIQSLQTSLRRTATSTKTTTDHHMPTIKYNFNPHRLPRKELKKAIFKRLNSLKGSNYAWMASSNHKAHMEGQTQTLDAMVDLLRQVRDTALSNVQSLLSLIAMPEPNKKLVDHHRKEYGVFRIKLTRVDSLGLWERISDVSDIRAVMKRLEEVEMIVDDMDNELEGIYRRLIRTRASLLNILTN